MPRTPSYIAYSVTQTSETKSRWSDIGVAFTNRDGSINVLLNALPLDGKIVLQQPKVKEKPEG
jgi:hypothetical protein